MLSGDVLFGGPSYTLHTTDLKFILLSSWDFCCWDAPKCFFVFCYHLILNLVKTLIMIARECESGTGQFLTFWLVIWQEYQPCFGMGHAAVRPDCKTIFQYLTIINKKYFPNRKKIFDRPGLHKKVFLECKWLILDWQQHHLDCM